MGDFSPSLNDVKIKSPTEDGKLAFLANTMVPRRLDQFDDIRNDLANKNFNTDKAFFYVNFQAGDFCGRSYKLPLSELNEFVTESLFFGTNGKDPIIGFDNNMYVDTDNEIHLVVDIEAIKDPEQKKRIEELMNEDAADYDPYLLINVLRDLKRTDNQIRNELYEEVANRAAGDTKLEEEKQNKFVILGSGDRLNSEGLPEPKPETMNDPYGVHVTYDPKDSEGNPIYKGPKIGTDPATGEDILGSAILIDHDYRFAQTITSKFDIGGIGKGQTILKGTPLETFLWQLLRGDPVIENIIYWKAADRLPIPASTWTGLGPWGHNKTTTNDDLLNIPDPDFTWKGKFEFTISTNDEFLLMAVPRSNSTGFKPDDQGQWVVPLLNSNKAPNGIRLNEIYLKDAPQFKVNFKTLEIRNEDESTEWGYKLYYIDEQSYYPQGQTWVAEFVPNN